MKKTIIALAALCGMAAADTEVLLSSTGSAAWTHSQTSITDGVLRSTAHWGSPCAYYTLNTPITLNSGLKLELSYTMTFYEASDVAATVALHSSSDVLAFGVKTYNGQPNDAPLCIGYSTQTDAINANAITFNQGYGYIMPSQSYTETSKTASITKNDNDSISSVDHAITETIAWNNDKQKYVATISVDDVVVGTQILGDSYTLEKISVASAGNGNTWYSQPSFSNMQLKVIPEPTTATLSLLALAGLAARRRRK